MADQDFKGTLAAEGTEAFELAEFETPVPMTPVLPVQWSVEKFKVAQMIALSGKTKTEIARITGVPLATINVWTKNSEFQEYIQKLVLESAELMKAKRLQLLLKMLEARIEEAEDPEGSGYGGLSRKDTLEIMAELRKETDEKDTAVQSNYEQLLGKLVELSATAAAPKPVQIEQKPPPPPEPPSE